MKSYCKKLVITESMVDQAVGEWLTGTAGRKNGWRIDTEYHGRAALVKTITEEIYNRNLSFKPIARHTRHEPTNGKVRIICVESVKQQVCDYLAVDCLKPLLDAKIGYYQVGAMPGKGGIFAKNAIRKWVRQGGHFVKSDVRKCYPSIKHRLVMRILRKYIRSEDVLYLAETLLETYGEGLDIGSYFSLKMSCLVISEAYHYIEGLTKVRRGKQKSLIEHQIWNMDDCLFISHDKRDLKIAVRKLEKFMLDELGLTIKPWKVSVISASEPIDMCGFRIFPDKIKLRRRLFLSGTRSFARFERSKTIRRARRCCSYWGYFLHSSTEDCRKNRGIDKIQSKARRCVATFDKMEGKHD